jgi:hypothetical protein
VPAIRSGGGSRPEQRLIPNLLTALRRQAEADPEAPFLFWPEGWNWRWWSWRQAAELAARWSAALAGLPAGAGTGFAGAAWPQAIVLDLAIQEAGLTPVPMNLGAGGSIGGADGGGPDGGGADGEGADGGTARAVEEPRAAAGGGPAAAPIELLVTLEGERPAALAPRITWLPARPGPPGTARPPTLVAGAAAAEEPGTSAGALTSTAAVASASTAAITPLSAPAAEAAGAGPAADAAGAGPAVVVIDAAGRWCALSQPKLMAAVAQVESAVGTPPGHRRRSQRREVLVAGWPLQQWPARLLTAWAITTGAALVLEADPARRQGTVLWARPTVFYGGGADLAALRHHVEATAARARRRHRSRPPALPLGRLRTLFQLAPPTPAEAAFWQQRGARLLQLPGVVC